MEVSLLKTLGGIAGIGGIAVGVLLLVFQDVIRKNIFPRLTKQHSYQLFRLIIIIVGIVAIMGIVCWTYISIQEKSKSSFTTPSGAPIPNTSPIVMEKAHISTLALSPTPTSNARLIPPGLKQPISVEASDAFSILGNVVDATEPMAVNKDPIAGAKIIIRHKQTGEETEAHSDELGAFTKVLPVGFYKVTVTHPKYFTESDTYNVTKKTADAPWRIGLRRKPDESHLAEGSIEGGAYDYVTNIPVPDVGITIKNEQTKIEYKISSGDHGEFSFRLPHGIYTVTFEHPQFKTQVLPCDTQKGSRCVFLAASSIRLRKIAK